MTLFIHFVRSVSVMVAVCWIVCAGFFYFKHCVGLPSRSVDEGLRAFVDCAAALNEVRAFHKEHEIAILPADSSVAEISNVFAIRAISFHRQLWDGTLCGFEARNAQQRASARMRDARSRASIVAALLSTAGFFLLTFIVVYFRPREPYTTLRSTLNGISPAISCL
jgi:hypothetical protein